MSKLQKTLLKLLEKKHTEKTRPAKDMGIVTDPWFWFSKYPVTGVEKKAQEGGPGSGCTGDNCGRPSGDSKGDSLQDEFSKKHPYVANTKVLSGGHSKNDAIKLAKDLRGKGQFVSIYHQAGPKSGEKSKYFLTTIDDKETKESMGDDKKITLRGAFEQFASRAKTFQKDSTGNEEVQGQGQGAEAIDANKATDWETEARQIILDNPQVSAGGLINTMKSKGIFEADSASSNVAAVRADDKKESNKAINIHARFLEGSAKNDAIGWTRFRVVILQEGLGNLKDAFYYSRQALESAITIFEGKKIYADHPTESEEINRPERSVKDVLGHFENIELVENEESGQAELQGDVVILPDEPYRWARGLLRHAVNFSEKFPDKDFVGLSINASGEAEPMAIDDLLKIAPVGAKQKIEQVKSEQGLSQIRVVKAISSAVSCDLVTEAGAGGKITKMIETKGESMKKKVKESEETMEKKEASPDAKADAKKEEALPVDAEKKDSATEHPDEKQDIELIKKMIAEYLGDDSEEEAKEMAMEAYESYTEMGFKADEAVKHAAAAVKLAKHMAAKQAKKESEETKEGEQKEEIPQDEMQMKKEEAAVEADEAKECDETKESCDAKKESNQVVELTGKIALLESQIKTFKMKDHLEKVCRESGLPMSATKMFKDLDAVKAAKSEDEVTKLMGVFKESYKLSGGEAEDNYKFLVHAEKTHSGKSSKKINLTECLRD